MSVEPFNRPVAEIAALTDEQVNNIFRASRRRGKAMERAMREEREKAGIVESRPSEYEELPTYSEEGETEDFVPEISRESYSKFAFATFGGTVEHWEREWDRQQSEKVKEDAAAGGDT